MIDLKQYEVWLVTGSQHLYGEETLKQVADHSQKIADAYHRHQQISVNGQCLDDNHLCIYLLLHNKSETILCHMDALFQVKLA